MELTFWDKLKFFFIVIAIFVALSFLWLIITEPVRSESYNDGYNEGYEVGYEDAMDYCDGEYDSWYERGYERGYVAGYDDAEQEFSIRFD